MSCIGTIYELGIYLWTHGIVTWYGVIKYLGLISMYFIKMKYIVLMEIKMLATVASMMVCIRLSLLSIRVLLL